MVSKKVAARRLERRRTAQRELGLPQDLWRNVAERLDLASLQSLRRSCLFLHRVASETVLQARFEEARRALEGLRDRPSASGVLMLRHRPSWSRTRYIAEYTVKKQEGDRRTVVACGVGLPVFRETYRIPTTPNMTERVLGLVRKLEVYDVEFEETPATEQPRRPAALYIEGTRWKLLTNV